MENRDLTLSFDIGHSSIGWAVFQKNPDANALPHALGCGTVLFPKDSCLAASRRGFRRSRRNIAARRSRVARLKNYLEKLGVLTRTELDENANSSPWFLAARVLKSEGEEKLSWQELWSVLRWYAHNRGYDGNALWAGDFIDDEGGGSGEGVPADVDSEDAKNVKHARELMEKYHTQSLAETFCAVLNVDPLGEKRSSRVYFKGSNAAFPRETVVAEVKKILEAHIGTLPKVDDALIRVLLKDVPAGTREELKLPARFSARGGLLFGQYVPRFDNRIIGKCRITGKNVPLKKCREFFLFRWGRLLNNLTVFGTNGEKRTLAPSERIELHKKMVRVGFFNKSTLNKALRETTHCEPANTESYFLTEEMEDALVLNPVKNLVASKLYLKDLWKHFSDHGKKIFTSQLASGKTLVLSKCIEQMKQWGDWDPTAFDRAFEEIVLAEKKKTPNRRRSADAILRLRFNVKFPSGRASYCKEILKKTFDEALAGKDSTQEGGCLYETEEIRSRLLKTPIEKQTNNHLVRHRLMIFGRLLDDIVAEYADGNATGRIDDVVVEVVRELKEFSGLSSQELKTKLNEKTGNFNAVVKELEESASKSDFNIAINGSLIRKARLLHDQGGTCPYTGEKISHNELFGGRLEIEHIIPRSLRPSDALSSCVLTFREVNEMKGQRTAMQFIKDCAGKTVPGLNFPVLPLKKFEEWVENHQKKKLGRNFYEDDRRRCRKRAELLLLEKYEQRNADFTERDLTQTSHLNKMAIRLVKQKLKLDARHLAGAITGFVRKNLNIDECLVAAVPRMQQAARDELGNSRKLLKSEMRELSHLHHAMDAVTQGLTGLLFKTEDWKLLVKRHLTDFDKSALRKKYPDLLVFSARGDLAIRPLDKTLLDEIRDRLKECRVVQHIPAKMHGMVVDQTTWRIGKFDEKTGKVSLEQHTTGNKGERLDAEGKRFVKTLTKGNAVKPSLLLGYGVPAGKLHAIKGVVQISENWGCVLEPTPTVIPFFKVFPKLRELREKNGGKPLKIIRNGMLIEVLSGTFKGIWKILSIKDNAGGVALDLNKPDKIKSENKTPDTKINVRLSSLIKFGLKILKPRLTGTLCPTTSSQSKAPPQS